MCVINLLPVYSHNARLDVGDWLAEYDDVCYDFSQAFIYSPIRMCVSAFAQFAAHTQQCCDRDVCLCANRELRMRIIYFLCAPRVVFVGCACSYAQCMAGRQCA